MFQFPSTGKTAATKHDLLLNFKSSFFFFFFFNFHSTFVTFSVANYFLADNLEILCLNISLFVITSISITNYFYFLKIKIQPIAISRLSIAVNNYCKLPVLFNFEISRNIENYCYFIILILNSWYCWGDSSLLEFTCDVLTFNFNFFPVFFMKRRSSMLFLFRKTIKTKYPEIEISVKS